ncbi:hypothetical protein [Burkholderia guangdongensis]|uniref:hypothetical protein n=1 Tax=Burkholderia guangdongensis TaxID=1792500 RepID=UPI0015CDF9DA|nr:hypothetical protein [Burkholderia guangdongensis]
MDDHFVDLDLPESDRRAAQAHYPKLFSELIARRPEALSRFSDWQFALAGDGAAKERLDRLSEFEAYYLGRGLQRADLKPYQAYLVDVETADRALVRRVQNGDMVGAVAHMATHPILRHLLWPRAEAAIREASHVNELIPLFGAMALDVHLGWMAAWDTNHAREQGSPSSSLGCLFPSEQKPGRNPTSLFFDKLKQRLDVDSAAQILGRIPVRRSGLDQSTLDRWSAGTRLPDDATLRVILRAYGLDQQGELLYAQLACSRHIHMLGHLAQRLQTLAREAAEPQWFWPWPAYAFEFPDFESWVAHRYPFWLEFHRNRSRDGTADRPIPVERED